MRLEIPEHNYIMSVITLATSNSNEYILRNVQVLLMQQSVKNIMINGASMVAITSCFQVITRKNKVVLKKFI